MYELSEGGECVRAVQGRGVCMSCLEECVRGCLKEGSVYELSEGGKCVRGV